jgi:hypothetical protein
MHKNNQTLFLSRKWAIFAKKWSNSQNEVIIALDPALPFRKRR